MDMAVFSCGRQKCKGEVVKYTHKSVLDVL